jgi:8-hydroxy-5-deazaflavin:NADPH oxidoreductase
MFSETARFGELLVLAVLGRVAEQVIQLAEPPNFSGKTLMDATN